MSHSFLLIPAYLLPQKQDQSIKGACLGRKAVRAVLNRLRRFENQLMRSSERAEMRQNQSQISLGHAAPLARYRPQPELSMRHVWSYLSGLHREHPHWVRTKPARCSMLRPARRPSTRIVDGWVLPMELPPAVAWRGRVAGQSPDEIFGALSRVDELRNTLRWSRNRLWRSRGP